MRKKKVTQHEKYIGERIREGRIALGMSQHALASMIGISYQQLQKYENGSNRVSGARIQIMATALNRPLTFFFPNSTDVRAQADPVTSQMLASKDGQEVLRTYPRLSAPSQRVVRDLMQHLLTKEQVNG
jgi:transcriptional regulator with XRE-family HTH domain